MDTIPCTGSRFASSPDPDDDTVLATAKFIHTNVRAFHLTGPEERAVCKAAERVELNSDEVLTLKRLNNQFGHLVP